ncbi:hypothetical protein J2X61_005821 [Bacillus sp. 3255]|nr:hypothetical protein [Bacillus sp. 3255]
MRLFTRRGLLPRRANRHSCRYSAKTSLFEIVTDTSTAICRLGLDFAPILGT